MRNKSDLHHYQKSAVAFAKDKLKCGLFLDMGLGKTATALTVAADLLDDIKVTKVLVIAPLRVANSVWLQEANEWAHLSHLKIVICTGSAAERSKALNSEADIYIINRESILWMATEVAWRWDMLIIDESSSFKSSKSKRFKALKKVIKHTTSVLLLTGTPSSNGLMDLWAQLYLIDSGERLGRTITGYRQRFFEQAGYMGYGYKPRAEAGDQIKSAIADICISMQAEDYIDLPDRIDINNFVGLPDNIRAQYVELEKEFILELESGDIEALSAGALMNKLLQFCNGAIYDEDGKAHEVHDLKIKALKELIEDNPDENMLIAYNFRSDLARLKKAFPKAVTLDKSGSVLKDWNAGKIRMLLAHPASAGHGLNAQFGGSIVVWFGLNWSLELYQQFNARLHRQGQLKPVRVVHIMAKDTVDEKVLKALGSKAATQSDILEYLRRQA